MSFFNELKRRNVFRVGIAYAVVSWLVLQVADIVFEAIGTPEWVMQTLLLVLAIGLLFVLFFAWAFELTPEGIKREKDVDRSQSISTRTGRKLDFSIIGLLVLALIYFIWESRFSGQEAAQPVPPAVSAQAEPEPTGVEPEPEITRQSIAVLPFDNRSDQQSDQHFVEGVHDDLLTNLARIGSLKVISRTSVNLYKNSQKSIPQIAEELGVATIMEGAVQRSGNTVRINVQLIDAGTDEHLWAEIFDRELTAENLFAIQSEISQKIADALETTLTEAEKDRINTMPTNNLAAYDAFVRGRQLMATRQSSKLKQATEAFNEAVELDPEFALAWVGVADSHFLLWSYGTLDLEEALSIGENAIEKALALDDQLGEAYASLGQVQRQRWQLEEAEASYLRAIELSPNYATAYHWYSIMVSLYPLRAQEQADLARKAVELDPRSAIIGLVLGSAYEDQGLFSRAERQYLKVIELEPGLANAPAGLATLYNSMGRFADAMEYYRKASAQDPGNPDYIGGQAFMYLQVGEADRAEILLQRLEEMDPERIGNGFASIWLNLVRGNRAGAREAMNWTLKRMQKANQPLNFFGWLETIDGNYQRARELFLASNPGWAEPDRWQGLIEQYQAGGCLFAWLLMKDGEQVLGDQLLQTTTAYLTEDLPAAVEHADLYNPFVCHLVAGDTQSAFVSLEMSLNHGHLGFMRVWFELPFFDLIRHEQRYLDLMSEYDLRIEEQRELIAKLDEGAAL